MDEKRTCFTGKYFRNIFKGEKGFTINMVMSDDLENIPESLVHARGRTMITVTGVDLPDLESVDILYYGTWVKNDKYGDQFKVDAYEISTPKTKKGIISFLKSDIFPGVGKKTAERIVAKFGTETLDILSGNPEKLLEVEGITPQRLGRIVSGYLQAKSYSELMIFLAEYGIGGNALVKINDKYGSQAIEVIKRDPYQIMDVAGIGFKTCDKIARGLHVSLDSYTRIKSSIVESVKALCESKGNMYVLFDELYQKSITQLNEGIQPAPVNKEKYLAVFEEMQKRKIVALRFKKVVYLMEYDEAERNVALKLLNMLDKPVGMKEELTWSLKRVVDASPIKPSEKQQSAVIRSLENRVAIITGGPGTGKTTITKAAISVFKDVMKEKVTCMAPTGKAARRMAEATGEDATTIHSRLGIYDDVHSEIEPIDSGLVVIDEVSMVDNFLMEKVMEAVNPARCQLLLIGDIHQLPSVGVGAVLSELINSKKIPTTMLTEIFRQKDGGLIVDNALKINSGKTDLEYGDDFVFIEANNEDEALNVISEIYPKEVNERGIDNVALLSPLRRSQNGRFKCVSDALNPVLQEIINKDIETTSGWMTSCKVGDREFRICDRVMMWKNKKDASNGDIGEITQIYEDEEEYGLTVRIKWDNGNETLAHKDYLEDITLAYSMSVHKSQGSEYDCVIIPILSSQSCQLFKRNLLYTGVTRAKKKVILVGDKKALNNCILQSDTNKRKTLLSERIIYNAEKDYPTVI